MHNFHAPLSCLMLSSALPTPLLLLVSNSSLVKLRIVISCVCRSMIEVNKIIILILVLILV